MTWLLFVVCALAVFRVAHMVALEEGPFALFERLRTWAFLRHRTTWIARGLNCPLCISLWVGLLIAPLMLWQTAPWWLWWPVLGLALSGVTVLIEKVRDRDTAA